MRVVEVLRFAVKNVAMINLYKKMILAIRITYQIGWLLIVCTHQAFKDMYESKFIYREISMNNEQMKKYCGENRLVIPACIHTRAHTTPTAAIFNNQC